MQRNDVFTKIAQQHLGIETLETRNRDSLDFHDVSVWGVKAALEAAYAAGQLATDKIRQKRIANGGSYLAAFEAKYQDIVDFFGEPSEGDQYKTEAEWRVLMPKGQTLKIYNYKTSKCYNKSYPDIKEVTRWHIGGVDRLLVDRLIAMMNGKAKLVHRQGE